MSHDLRHTLKHTFFQP